MTRTTALVVAAVVASATAGCRRESPPAFVPGLGEIMSLNQMRHAKLWFAGEAGNWPLAAYELDELKEGFDDAASLHPTHKDAPLPINQLIPKMMSASMADLDKAIAAKNHDRFVSAFDDLTKGCNGCHQATNFGFNVVTRPAGNSYTNQTFPPPQ